mmetsp:Transcript_58113/g.168425  ORF Transcript_58113/g.168425 Transcript_58113/m.168425 type:complete len:209 (-) Transcript_58113:49-675(-)
MALASEDKRDVSSSPSSSVVPGTSSHSATSATPKAIKRSHADPNRPKSNCSSPDAGPFPLLAPPFISCSATSGSAARRMELPHRSVSHPWAAQLTSAALDNAVARESSSLVVAAHSCAAMAMRRSSASRWRRRSRSPSADDCTSASKPARACATVWKIIFEIKSLASVLAPLHPLSRKQWGSAACNMSRHDMGKDSAPRTTSTTASRF